MRSIQTVAVIGAGEQGRAFALRCARAGFGVVLEDVMPAKLRQAEQELSKLELREGEGGVAGRVSFALTVEDAVREADVAIDFVPDELESKLEIFCLLDRMAPPRTILCTPTRALSISDLAACTYRADRCVGLDATGPELAGAQIGLVAGQLTGAAVLDAVTAWLERLAFRVDRLRDERALARA